MSRKQSQTKRDPSSSKESRSAQADSQPIDPALERAMRHVQTGNYERALHLLDAAGRDAPIRNARGVCLLRMGRYDDAVRVLRELVLSPGCTWMRTDLPTSYKANFATALLLGGHPAGCLEILSEINDEQHPSIQRLRADIKRWQKSLSFWQWLNWKISRVEPASRPPSLDYPPGEFDVEISPPAAETGNSPTSPLRTAI